MDTYDEMDVPGFDTNLLPAADPQDDGHPPRILLLYGSTRERSYSRLLSEEAARILRHLGAETRLFDPSGLPLPDDAAPDHPKVVELYDLVSWSEGQVWCSPERHGAMSAVFKAQIDWMRMLTLPNQSSVPKAFLEFDEQGRMKPSAYYDRVVDVMEELMKFTRLLRGHGGHLVDRYLERKESAAELSQRVNQRSL